MVDCYKKIWTPEEVHAYMLQHKTIKLPTDAYITKDFKWNELFEDWKDARGGYSNITIYPSSAQLNNLLGITTTLQTYRNTVLKNTPIHITGGIRSPEYNNYLLERFNKGLSTSKPGKYSLHMDGKALDIDVGWGGKFHGADESITQSLLDPIHHGGLEFPKKSNNTWTHLDSGATRGFDDGGHTLPRDPKVLNKDLSNNNIVLEGYARKTVDSTGREINLDGKGPSLAANIDYQKLSAKDFYDPRTEQVNYDVTQRVLSKDGNVTSSPTFEGSVTQTDLAASSDPASLNKFFKTPNMESITNVLYSGVQLGAGFLRSYLTSRADELLFGKEGAKKVSKIREFKGYYDTAKAIVEKWGAIKEGAKVAWSAVKAVAQTAWHAISSFAVQAAQWVGTAISSAASTIAGAVAGAITTAATAIAGAAAAVGSAIASGIGWVIVALTAFPW